MYPWFMHVYFEVLYNYKRSSQLFVRFDFFLLSVDDKNTKKYINWDNYVSNVYSLLTVKENLNHTMPIQYANIGKNWWQYVHLL